MAGANFQKVLYKDDRTGGVDLAFDPRNPQIVYAVLWQAQQGPWENGAFSGPNSGLYKSTDGGDHWSQLTGGLPTFEKDGLGRIGIGIAPSDGNRMYALVEARGQARRPLSLRRCGRDVAARQRREPHLRTRQRFCLRARRSQRIAT